MAPNNPPQRCSKPTTSSPSKSRIPETDQTNPCETPLSLDRSYEHSRVTITVSISRKSSPVPCNSKRPVSPCDKSESPKDSVPRSRQTHLPSPSYARNAANIADVKISCEDTVTRSRHRPPPVSRTPSRVQLPSRTSVKNPIKVFHVPADTLSRCRQTHVPTSSTRKSHAPDGSKSLAMKDSKKKSRAMKGSTKTACDASRSGRNVNVPGQHSPTRTAQASHAVPLDEAASLSVLMRNTEANAQRIWGITCGGTEASPSIYRSKASKKAGQRGSHATLPATKERSSASSFQPSVKAPPKATSAARTDLAHGKVLGPEDIARFQPQPSDISSTNKTVMPTQNTTNVQTVGVPTSCVTSRSKPRKSTKRSRGTE